MDERRSARKKPVERIQPRPGAASEDDAFHGQQRRNFRRKSISATLSNGCCSSNRFRASLTKYGRLAAFLEHLKIIMNMFNNLLRKVEFIRKFQNLNTTKVRALLAKRRGQA
jgi:hypothetical protein